jgi:hypothetical protein
MLRATLLASVLCFAASASAQEEWEVKKAVGRYGFEVTAEKKVSCRKLTSADAKTFQRCASQNGEDVVECRVSEAKAFWVYKTKKACNQARTAWYSDEYQG